VKPLRWKELADSLLKEPAGYAMPIDIQTVMYVLAARNTTEEIRYGNLNLRSAFLRELHLRPHSKFEMVDFSDAILFKSNLVSVNLEGANLTGADLRGGTLLRDANLRSSSLVSAKLDSVDLRGADLSYAKLRGAFLTGVIWDDSTNVTLANLESATIDPAFERWALSTTRGDRSDRRCSAVRIADEAKWQALVQRFKCAPAACP